VNRLNIALLKELTEFNKTSRSINIAPLTGLKHRTAAEDPPLTQ